MLQKSVTSRDLQQQIQNGFVVIHKTPVIFSELGSHYSDVLIASWVEAEGGHFKRFF
jgi:hypothetical protein